MKRKHTVEISALDLIGMLREKLGIEVYACDIDLRASIKDVGGFSSGNKAVESITIEWTEGGNSHRDVWER